MLSVLQWSFCIRLCLPTDLSLHSTFIHTAPRQGNDVSITGTVQWHVGVGDTCKTEDVECKLSGFDTLPVNHGFIVKSGDAYSALIANPFHDGKTMSQIFASVPSGGQCV